MKKPALILTLAALIFSPKQVAKQELENKVNNISINTFASSDRVQVNLTIPAIPVPSDLENTAFYDLNDDGIYELIGSKNSLYRIFKVDDQKWKEIFRTKCSNFRFLTEMTNGYYNIEILDKDTTLYFWNFWNDVYEQVK